MITDLQTKDLAWFCKLGRFMAGFDTHPDGPLKPMPTVVPSADAPPVAVVSFVPPAVEPLGPIEAAEKKVIMDAIDECDGNVERAARRLDISRGTIYGRLKKWGYTKARENIVKLAGAAVLLVCVGCAGTTKPQALTPRAQAIAIELPVISQAETPMLRTTFAFDASPDASVTGYKLHWGESIGAITNTVLLGTNRVVTIEHDSYPLHATATAYNAAGIESVPSNQAGVLGTQTVVRGYDQRAPTLGGPFEDAGLVFSRTNPPTTFHRLRIERREELVNYP